MVIQNYDPNPPARPSGIRLGTSIITTMGLRADDMQTVAAYINRAIENYGNDDILQSIKSEIKDWLTC